MAESARTSQPVIVKKYANRRLYDTSTSRYVTLLELYDMVRDGKEFVVQDAKTGQDLTRQILTQIILEQEGRGVHLLPASFLRNVIQVYDENMREVLPHYLEASMENFTRNQQSLVEMWGRTFNQMSPFGQLEEIGKQNMALFEQTMRMFNPLSGGKKGD